MDKGTYRIYGPEDAQNVLALIGTWGWFRTSLENARGLPMDTKFANQLMEVRPGIPAPYVAMSPHSGLPFVLGCGYFVQWIPEASHG